MAYGHEGSTCRIGRLGTAENQTVYAQPPPPHGSLYGTAHAAVRNECLGGMRPAYGRLLAAGPGGRNVLKKLRDDSSFLSSPKRPTPYCRKRLPPCCGSISRPQIYSASVFITKGCARAERIIRPPRSYGNGAPKLVLPPAAAESADTYHSARLHQGRRAVLLSRCEGHGSVRDGQW